MIMTEDNHDIDLKRLSELMEDYQSTTTREKQRQIENEVLAETVWKVRQENHLLSEADLKTLLDRIDDDDEVAKRILIRPFVNKL